MRFRNRQRGSALVLSLAVLAGLVAVMASIAASQHQAIKAQINREERSRALLAVQSGVQRAVATLAAITQAGQSGATTTTTAGSSTANTTAATTTQDDWSTLGQTGDENFVVGNLKFRMQIVDGSSFLNVNTLTTAQLNNLPLTQDEIASWLDYRSAGTTPRTLGGKDEYYNNLQNPYDAKEANFETVDELLQVKGLTAEHIYQVRTDVQTSAPPLQDVNGNQLPLSAVLTAVSWSAKQTATGGNLINVNTATNAARISRLLSPGVAAAVNGRRNWTSLGQLCGIRGASTTDLSNILNNFAVNNTRRVSGLVNINTATQSVLQVLPGLTPDLAAAIVQQQSQGFTSLGDITRVNGITGAVLSQLADSITANSQTFIVRVIGTAGSTSIPYEAILNVQNGVPQIIQMQEQPFTDMITRWGWNDSTSTDTVLKDNS